MHLAIEMNKAGVIANNVVPVAARIVLPLGSTSLKAIQTLDRQFGHGQYKES